MAVHACGVGSLRLRLVWSLSRRHIQTYWTAANRLAAQSPFLGEDIGPKDAAAAKNPRYQAAFPKFITRLFVPPVLFAIAHLAWGIYVTALACGACAAWKDVPP